MHNNILDETYHPGQLSLQLPDDSRKRPAGQVQQPPTFPHRFPVISTGSEFFGVGNISRSIVVDSVGDDRSEFRLDLSRGGMKLQDEQNQECVSSVDHRMQIAILFEGTNRMRNRYIARESQRGRHQSTDPSPRSYEAESIAYSPSLTYSSTPISRYS